MIPIKCIKPCNWLNREWKVGDTLKITRNMDIPAEFTYPKGNVHVLEPENVGIYSITLIGNSPAANDYKIHHDNVAVLNMKGATYPHKINYWFTLHPELFGIWCKYRSRNNFTLESIKYVSNKKVRNPVITYSTNESYGGGSGLYAIEFLSNIGYKHIHMKGIELTGPYNKFRKYWENYTPRVKLSTDDTGWVSEWVEYNNKKLYK